MQTPVEQSTTVSGRELPPGAEFGLPHLYDRYSVFRHARHDYRSDVLDAHDPATEQLYDRLFGHVPASAAVRGLLVNPIRRLREWSTRGPLDPVDRNTLRFILNFLQPGAGGVCDFFAAVASETGRLGATATPAHRSKLEAMEAHREGAAGAVLADLVEDLGRHEWTEDPSPDPGRRVVLPFVFDAPPAARAWTVSTRPVRDDAPPRTEPIAHVLPYLVNRYADGVEQVLADVVWGGLCVLERSEALHRWNARFYGHVLVAENSREVRVLTVRSHKSAVLDESSAFLELALCAPERPDRVFGLLVGSLFLCPETDAAAAPHSARPLAARSDLHLTLDDPGARLVGAPPVHRQNPWLILAVWFQHFVAGAARFVAHGGDVIFPVAPYHLMLARAVDAVASSLGALHETALRAVVARFVFAGLSLLLAAVAMSTGRAPLVDRERERVRILLRIPRAEVDREWPEAAEQLARQIVSLRPDAHAAVAQALEHYVRLYVELFRSVVDAALTPLYALERVHLAFQTMADLGTHLNVKSGPAGLSYSARVRRDMMPYVDPLIKQTEKAF